MLSTTLHLLSCAYCWCYVFSGFRKSLDPLSQAASTTVNTTENAQSSSPSSISHCTSTVTSSGVSAGRSNSSPSLTGLLSGSYAPSKRQLTEDTDASDCELVFTSKKQRTRNLEMSRKEGKLMSVRNRLCTKLP